jgi:O-antigen ligase
MNNASKIWILAAAFLVVAPLSVSGGATSTVKYCRLFITLLIFYYAYISMKMPTRMRGARSLLNFVVFFVAAAAWSDAIVNALMSKGMLFITISGGLAMAYCIDSAKDMIDKMKLLAYTGGASSFIMVYLYRANPDENLAGNRLSVVGMNANTIGASAAPFFLLCLFLLLKPDSTLKRVIHLGSATMLLGVILMTGSRAAVLMAALGALIILKPVFQKQIFSGAIVLMIPLMLYQTFNSMTAGGAELTPGVGRLTAEKTTNTRLDHWSHTYKEFQENMLIGKGWLHWKGRGLNTHNIYLHILAETGLLGAFVFLVFLIQIFSVYRENMTTAKNEMDSNGFSCFGSALVASILLHGMVEDAALVGTTSNALFLGFSVGLLDRSILFEIDPAGEQAKLHPWAVQRDKESNANKFET